MMKWMIKMVLVAALAAAVAGSLPDIKRYLKMRTM